MQRLRRHWGLWLATGIGATAYAALAVLHQRHDTLRAGVTPTTIAWVWLAFVGFALAVWWNERRPIPVLAYWVVPIGFRLLLLSTEPTLSDDVYRYLWDGHVVTEGVSPYSYAISDPELDPYEIPARRLANNPGLASPYLPATHVVFAAAAALLPSEPLSLQLVMTMFDLGSALLLGGILTRLGLPGRRALIYLWNPLAIVEVAHGAHLDALMVFLALLAVRLSLAAPSPRRWSPVALALGTLTRPLPLLLAPVLWWRWTWSQRMAFAAVLAGGLVPFGFGVGGWGLLGEPTGRGLFGSARVYSQEFRFNAGLYRWIETTAEQLTGSTDAATGVVAVMMAAVLGGVWLVARRPIGDRRTLRLLAVPIFAYLLLTPVFHPWYLLLAVALLTLLPPGDDECADRWLLLAPWLWLAASSFASYLTYQDPAAFAERAWVRDLEWWPTVGLLVLSSFWVFFAVQAEPSEEAPASTGTS